MDSQGAWKWHFLPQRHGWKNDEDDDEEEDDEEIPHDGDFVEREFSERGGADADRQHDERDEHEEIGDYVQSLTSLQWKEPI